MKTQDTIDEQIPSPESKRLRGISQLASAGAILVVLLIIGVSAVVFAQLSRQHEQSQPQAPLPPSGNWVQVLKGYTITSVVAATSTPSTLYACAIQAQHDPSVTSNSSSYTILRSTDFGTHWQDVGSKAALGLSCQLAINPTHSNELYAMSMLDNGQATSVLRYSSDAGQTWETIQPVLNIAGSGSTPAWSVQNISMVGTTLFGTQWLSAGAKPSTHTMPRVLDGSNRLVSSTDGGHTWTVLDQQFASTSLSVSSYAVDPSHTSTIYELVGTPWLPIQPGGVEPNDIIPPYGTTADLYKTTDGGAHWQALLQKLPFTTQVHLATDNPQLIYVGGTRRPLPYIVMPPASYPSASVVGGFHLQVSSNGGTTWNNVPDLPAAQAYNVSNWFINSSGQVYVISTVSGASSTNGNGIPATAVVTPSKAPAGPPQLVPPSANSSFSMEDYHPAVTPPPTYSAGSFGSIQRYDQGSNAWSVVTKAPAYGTLLTATSGNANRDVLWFAGNTIGQASLYRYIA